MSNNSKKPTMKQMRNMVNSLNNNMILMDQHYSKSIQDLVVVINHYIKFQKNTTKFETFMKKTIETAKKEAEKKAKDQENKEVTAKDKSEVPEK
jgi:hypothetical protein